MYKNAFTLIELLVVVVIIGVLIALLLPAVQAAREAARKGQCQNGMMQTILAVKAYEEALGVLPSGTVNETGPIRNVPIGNHIGWIPRILPFIELVPLYDKIDFSKGVYDKANESVWIFPAPRTFRCPSDGVGFVHPNFKACYGGTETPIDADNNGVFFLNSKLRSKDISDGTSYTVFLGESCINRSRRREEETFPRKVSYASLGWMSGTPGTLRNTGNKMNARQIIATWAMPFGFDGSVYTNIIPYPVDRERGDLRQQSSNYSWYSSSGLPFQFSRSYDTNTWDINAESEEPQEEETVQAEEQPVDEETEFATPKMWAKEVKGQFLGGGFSSHHVGGVNHAFGDGSVRTVFETIDEKVYSLLGQRNDNQVLSLE